MSSKMSLIKYTLISYHRCAMECVRKDWHFQGHVIVFKRKSEIMRQNINKMVLLHTSYLKMGACSSNIFVSACGPHDANLNVTYMRTSKLALVIYHMEKMFFNALEGDYAILSSLSVKAINYFLSSYS